MIIFTIYLLSQLLNLSQSDLKIKTDAKLGRHSRIFQTIVSGKGA
jgi:hypothetical protein